MGDQSSHLPASDKESLRARALAWAKPRAAAVRRLISHWAEKERSVQQTREDQFTMAALGHAVILVGVFFIVWRTFGGVHTGHSLHYFYLSELIIVLIALIAMVSSRQIVSALDKNVISLQSIEAWMNRKPKLKHQVQTAVLFVIFLLQFASMLALLVATGGPIDSPFAPMALGIGVFTPVILNKWWTVVTVIAATMLFYGLITYMMGFSDAHGHPQPGAYAAVNIFILLAASVITLRSRDALSFKLRKIVEAPPEQVWKAWTDRRQVGRWIGADGDSQITMKVKEGGTWRVSTPGRDGRQAAWSGVFVKVDPPERLVFTIDARSGIGEEVIAVDLKRRGEVTEMIVTQTDNGRQEGLRKGWSAFMDRLGSRAAQMKRKRTRKDT